MIHRSRVSGEQAPRRTSLLAAAGLLATGLLTAVWRTSGGRPWTEGDASRDRGAALAAVGRIADCSGVLVSARHVLTARHCHVRSADWFCLGAATDRCIQVASVAEHPTLDIAVVTLARGLRRPAALPIGPAPLADVGSQALWAGTGEGPRGARRKVAAAVSITAVWAASLRTHSPGEGPCFGDSGGPLLVEVAGVLTVVGVLHAGDGDCKGDDEYTRVDAAEPWLSARLGAGGQLGSSPPGRPTFARAEWR